MKGEKTFTQTVYESPNDINGTGTYIVTCHESKKGNKIIKVKDSQGYVYNIGFLKSKGIYSKLFYQSFKKQYAKNLN